jgi:hypothetical protein
MNCRGDEKKVERKSQAAGRTGRFPWLAVLVIGGLILAAAAAGGAGAGWFGDMFKKSPAEAAKVSGVVETVDEVRIPLKSLDPEKAIFLQAELGGSPLYYFALKSSDGAYHAAFDACNGCFRTNLGYRQEEDRMVCNKCEVAFPSVRIGEITGGCNPNPLAYMVEGQYLVIRKSDIAAGKNYFPGNRS